MQSLTKKLTWSAGFAFFMGCELMLAAHQTSDPRRPNDVVMDLVFKAHDEAAMFGRRILPGANPPRAVEIYVQTTEGATVDMTRRLGDGKTFTFHDLYRAKPTAMGIGFFSY